jgi:RNA ligase
MKIKGEEYLRLHRIMTNVSTTAVWEILSSGGDMTEILKDVPDEFYIKINNYTNELKSQYNLLNTEYNWIFKKCEPFKTDRAKFANIAKMFKYPSLLFGILDGKDISSTVWKIVKPKFEKL